MPSAVGPGYYTFEPYNYGPFSKQVYIDAENLMAGGLLARVAHPGGNWMDYVATPSGTREAGCLAKGAPPKSVDYLAKLVDWVYNQPFPQLVKWVYANFPEYRINSIFSD